MGKGLGTGALLLGSLQEKTRVTSMMVHSFDTCFTRKAKNRNHWKPEKFLAARDSGYQVKRVRKEMKTLPRIRIP